MYLPIMRGATHYEIGDIECCRWAETSDMPTHEYHVLGTMVGGARFAQRLDNHVMSTMVGVRSFCTTMEHRAGAQWWVSARFARSIGMRTVNQRL